MKRLPCRAIHAIKTRRGRCCANSYRPLRRNPRSDLEEHPLNLHKAGEALSQDVSPRTLQLLLSYDPSTGNLTWKPRGIEWFSPVKGPEKRMAWWNAQHAAKPALFTPNGGGYLCGTVLNKRLLAHRACWAVYYGEFPLDVIDHINGDPADNRIANLRDVSIAVNGRNSAMKSNNVSGISGVWDKRPKKWGKRWAVALGGKEKMIYKSFHCLGDAIEYRNSVYAANGFTERHGTTVRGISS